MMRGHPRLARNPGEPPRSRRRNSPHSRASPLRPHCRRHGHAARCGRAAATPPGGGQAMRRAGPGRLPARLRGAAVSALDSLIRLHRWQVDERRRHVADLEGLAAQLTEEHHRLDREETREQAAAPPEAAATYAAYARQLIERRRKLAQSQAEVAERIERSRAALAEAVQEVKRYEIMAANRTRQQQRREVRRQQQALDDRGADAFRRRGAGKD